MAWTGDRRQRPRRGARRLPESQRRRVLKRDPLCKLAIPNVCTGHSQQVDHVRDDADGGPDEDWNLQGCCAACHRWKSARNSAARANNGTRVLREKERHPGILP